MHIKLKECMEYNTLGEGIHTYSYTALDGWLSKDFSIGYDYTLYDGLQMRSLRLGWVWFSLCEQVEIIEKY